MHNIEHSVDFSTEKGLKEPDLQSSKRYYAAAGGRGSDESGESDFQVGGARQGGFRLRIAGRTLTES